MQGIGGEMRGAKGGDNRRVLILIEKGSVLFSTVAATCLALDKVKSPLVQWPRSMRLTGVIIGMMNSS